MNDPSRNWPALHGSGNASLKFKVAGRQEFNELEVRVRGLGRRGMRWIEGL